MAGAIGDTRESGEALLLKYQSAEGKEMKIQQPTTRVKSLK